MTVWYTESDSESNGALVVESYLLPKPHETGKYVAFLLYRFVGQDWYYGKFSTVEKLEFDQWCELKEKRVFVRASEGDAKIILKQCHAVTNKAFQTLPGKKEKRTTINQIVALMDSGAVKKK